MSTPRGGEIQVTDAWLVALNAPCVAGAVCDQAMVNGSPSGSVAVMARVTTSPATGIAGVTMIDETTGGPFTMTCLTVSWSVPDVEPPWPSPMLTWK